MTAAPPTAPATPAALPPLGPNPYVGLRPLQPGETIYGRVTEIRDLFYRLNSDRIVMLHAPSGAGKTSLVTAGLIPKLSQEDFDVWPTIRVNQEPPAGNLANRYVFSTLISLQADLPDPLRKDPLALGSLTLAQFAAGRPRRQGAPLNVMLIFDQFEEILTIDPGALDAKKEFFRQLGELLRDRQIWALFVIREEYLAQFNPFAPLVPTQWKSRFRLDLLSLDDAGKAIQEPARKAGRIYAPGVAGQLVQDLAQVSVEQANGEPIKQTGQFVEPAQLQVVCKRLWDQIPADVRSIGPEDFKKLGDDYVTQALGAYYDDEVAHASGGAVMLERAIREWFGEALLNSGGIRAQVMQGTTAGLTSDAIKKLLDAHLIRSDKRRGATWYELENDRIIAPVLASNQTWLEAKLQPFQWRAKFWEQSNHSEALLLLDPDLAQAETVTKQPGFRLTDVEDQFLKESRVRGNELLAARLEKRGKRRLYWALAGAVVVLLLVGFAYFGKQRYAKFLEQYADALEDSNERARTALLKVLKVAPFPVAEISELENADPGEIAPLDPADKDWEPVIVEDGKPFAIARTFQQGRIVAVGHEGFLNQHRSKGSLFLQLALLWLNGAGEQVARISDGHEEQFNRDKDDREGLVAKLKSEDWKYDVDFVENLANNQELNDGIGVLIIGNRWQSFTKDELDAVETFVGNGGGLLVTGLGWRWQENHAGANLDTYPMNQLLQRFGAHWTTAKIDTTAKIIEGPPARTRKKPE